MINDFDGCTNGYMFYCLRGSWEKNEKIDEKKADVKPVLLYNMIMLTIAGKF